MSEDLHFSSVFHCLYSVFHRFSMAFWGVWEFYFGHYLKVMNVIGIYMLWSITSFRVFAGIEFQNWYHIVAISFLFTDLGWLIMMLCKHWNNNSLIDYIIYVKELQLFEILMY